MAEETQIPSMADFEKNSQTLADQVEETNEDVEKPGEETEEVEEQPETNEEVEPQKEETGEEVEEEVEVENKEDDPSEFWADVEKLTGYNVDVDYGDLDPLSPEGVAKREESVMQFAIDSFLEQLKNEYPKVYAGLEHSSNGGDLEDLFTPGEKDYSKIEIGDDNDELAKRIVFDYYKSKGATEKRIKRIVDSLQDSEEDDLVEEARELLKELQTDQKTKREQAFATQEKQAEELKNQDLGMIDTINGFLKGGKVGSFNIPKADFPNFQRFVLSRVQRSPDNSGYLFVKPLDKGDLEKQLQYEFFEFKKGDLSKFIDTNARTQNVKRLKTKLNQKENTKGLGGDRKKNIRTMKDFNKS